MQGGAYGGSCSFDPVSGIFSYLSYRDPNLLSTLDVYDRTGQFLREQDLDTTELTRSVVGSIGALGRYQLPDAKGFTSLARYLIGETDESPPAPPRRNPGDQRRRLPCFADVLDQVTGAGPGGRDGFAGRHPSRPTRRGPGLLEVAKVL